jgi:RNase P subunit RPR2
MTAFDPCDWCEEVLQPYLDRELTDAEVREAESHLAKCAYCGKRYRFELSLRRYVYQAVAQPMAPALRQRLTDLRLEL